METGARAHLHEAMGKVKSGVLIAPEVQEAWEALKKWAASLPLPHMQSL